uniref:Uncharacterized protein n=1 Tax=Anguilla anguilla TaxID=7936 RepID=A0A0E9VN91_ANGAN
MYNCNYIINIKQNTSLANDIVLNLCPDDALSMVFKIALLIVPAITQLQ